MRAFACAVLSAFVLSGCGHGFYPAPPDTALPQVSLQSPVQNLVAFNDAAPLALYGANPVVPLFAIPDINTNIGTLDVAFWGTKDASGTITQLTQAGVSGLASNVHVFFDTSERPIYVRDDGSGYAFKLSYDSPTQQTVTLCDPSGAALASAPILISGETAQAGSAYAGGSCSLGLTAAVRAVHGSSLPQSTGTPTSLSNLASLAQAITASSYVAGMGFALAAILKFQSHKPNPTTQVPVGTAIALLFIAAALLFIPAIFSTTGATLFESYATAAATDGLASFLPETSITGCASASASCPFPSPDPTP